MAKEKVNDTIKLVTEKNYKGKCFVMMPFSERGDYQPGHWKKVYDNLIAPACRAAGYEPEDGHLENQSDDILASMLRALVTYEMALCDISSANPNVLYELAIRQMAKMPVMLIKDELEPESIFNIHGIRAISYKSTLYSYDVSEEIKDIVQSLTSTHRDRENITSAFLERIGVELKISKKTIEVSPEIKRILEGVEMMGETIRGQTQKIAQMITPNPSQFFLSQTVATGGEYIAPDFWRDHFGRPLTAHSLLRNTLSGDPAFYVFCGALKHGNGHISAKLLNCRTEIFEVRSVYSYGSYTIDMISVQPHEMNSVDNSQKSVYSRYILSLINQQ